MGISGVMVWVRSIIMMASFPSIRRGHGGGRRLPLVGGIYACLKISGQKDQVWRLQIDHQYAAMSAGLTPESRGRGRPAPGPAGGLHGGVQLSPGPPAAAPGMEA